MIVRARSPAISKGGGTLKRGETLHEISYGAEAIKMSFLDLHRRAWALRCLREAKVSLTGAMGKEDIASLSHAVLALKRAQSAIYHVLGGPEFVGLVVKRHVKHGKEDLDPLLRFLVEIEQMIFDLSGTAVPRRDVFMRKAASIVSTTEEIIKVMLDGEGV